MANRVYPLSKQAAFTDGPNCDMTTGLKVQAIDLAFYTYSNAHEFLDDVDPAALVGTAMDVTGETWLAGAIFDADDGLLPITTGPTVEALLFYKSTGVDATSRLWLYMDTGVLGLPFTPNGVNPLLQFDEAGIVGM